MRAERHKEPGELDLPQEITPLVKVTGRPLSLPAKVHFGAAEHYRVGESDGVEIADIGNGMRALLEVDERDIPELTALTMNMTSRALPFSLLQNADPFTLSHLWDMLKMQHKGEKGKLLTNAWPTAFPSVDKSLIVTRWHDPQNPSPQSMNSSIRRGWSVGRFQPKPDQSLQSLGIGRLVLGLKK